MIGYVKGKVLNVSDNVALIENGGIGYEITCSSSALSKLGCDGLGEVYTYLAVREDGVNLYGFSSLKEKNAFLKLISVSGVGAKMGITILSGMELNELLYVIASSNVKALSKVKGVGKKTAERIILELRESVGEQDELLASSEIKSVNKTDVNEDAVLALMSLGFTRAECVNAVLSAQNSGASDIESIIAYAIKNVK